MPGEAADSVILAQLCQKKIVMVGDGAHAHRYFYQLVLRVLRVWLDSVVKSAASQQRDDSTEIHWTRLQKPVPHRVILFLESDTLQARAMNDYINTGDIGNYFGFWVDLASKWDGTELFSVDKLEFLSGLRGIQRRIEGINSSMSGPGVDLLIRGAESDPPYNWKDKWSMKDFDDKIGLPWFAHVRDQQIALNIERILAENPEYRALVFYGTGHLQRQKLDKSFGSRLTQDPSMIDYYAAHFLDDYYGRPNVSVFTTAHASGWGGSSEGRVIEYYYDPIGADYLWNTSPVPPATFPVLMVNSERHLAYMMGALQPHLGEQNDLDQSLAMIETRLVAWQLQRSSLCIDSRARAMLDSVCAATRYIETFWRGKERAMKILSELISRHDAVKSIEHVKKWFFPVDELPKKFYSTKVSAILSNLPSDSLCVPESPSQMTQANWKELKEYLLIGLLWAGTDREQRDAFEALHRLTGRDFANPDEWTAWWFSNQNSYSTPTTRSMVHFKR